jgi:hypothetical protein
MEDILSKLEAAKKNLEPLKEKEAALRNDLKTIEYDISNQMNLIRILEDDRNRLLGNLTEDELKHLQEELRSLPKIVNNARLCSITIEDKDTWYSPVCCALCGPSYPWRIEITMRNNDDKVLDINGLSLDVKIFTGHPHVKSEFKKRLVLSDTSSDIEYFSFEDNNKLIYVEDI